MARIHVVFAAVAAILISLSPAVAGEYPGFNHPLWATRLKDGAKVPSTIVEQVVGPCMDRICHIKDNPGGKIEPFWFAGREATRRTDIGRIEVAGFCNSSCVIFIDAARSKVCLHRDAILGFHLGSIDPNRVPENQRHLIQAARVPPLADDILKIVEAHGGLGEKMIGIRGAVFSSIWPACGTTPPAQVSQAKSN